MQQADTDKIQSILNTVKGSTAVSVDIESPPSMNKRGNPFYGRIIKCSTIHGLVGCSYGKAVRNQAARENKLELTRFVAQKPSWGTVEGIWKVHTLKNGRTYRYIRIMAISPQKPTYKLDGEVISDEAVEELFENTWLKKSRKPLTQEGLSKEIVWREPRLDHVVAVRMFGDTFVAKIEQHLESVLRKREQGRLTTIEIVYMFQGVPEVTSEIEALEIEQERERIEGMEAAISTDETQTTEIEYDESMTPEFHDF